MANVCMPLRWAPEALAQPIFSNWNVHLFTVDMGATSDPQMERKVIDRVGSYGRQIGHLSEALEVVIRRLRLLEDEGLSRDERDALQVFLGDVAAVRQLKSDRR